MESATIRRAPPLPGLVQAGLIGLLLVLAAGAWATTGGLMSGMDAGPGSDPGTLAFFLGAWVVMMAAMMFPSIAPMVALYDKMAKRPGATVSRASHTFREAPCASTSHTRANMSKCGALART